MSTSLPRILVTIVAALAAVWVLAVLASGIVTAYPTEGSGEGRHPDSATYVAP